jgi:hypothetical protein
MVCGSFLSLSAVYQHDPFFESVNSNGQHLGNAFKMAGVLNLSHYSNINDRSRVRHVQKERYIDIASPYFRSSPEYKARKELLGGPLMWTCARVMPRKGNGRPNLEPIRPRSSSLFVNGGNAAVMAGRASWEAAPVPSRESMPDCHPTPLQCDRRWHLSIHMRSNKAEQPSAPPLQPICLVKWRVLPTTNTRI